MGARAPVPHSWRRQWPRGSMMRFVLIMNDQPWSDTVHIRRLSFLVALTPGRIITRLSRLAFWDLLETGDGGLAGPDNPRV